MRDHDALMACLGCCPKPYRAHAWSGAQPLLSRPIGSALRASRSSQIIWLPFTAAKWSAVCPYAGRWAGSHSGWSQRRATTLACPASAAAVRFESAMAFAMSAVPGGGDMHSVSTTIDDNMLRCTSDWLCFAFYHRSIPLGQY